MSTTRELAEHFYRETSSRLSGYVGSSYRRQQNDVTGHIDAVIREYGPAAASTMLHELVEFSENYPGGQDNLFMGDVFQAIGELREAGIESGTQDYRENLEHMADNELFDTSDYDPKQDVPAHEQQLANSLNQALAHQKQQLNRAMGPYQDETEVRSIESMIQGIERNIQALNPSAVPQQSAPDQPVLSPEAQARQNEANKEVQDGIRAHDARMAALGTDDVYAEGEDWEEVDYG